MSLFLSYFDQHFEGTCRVPLSILFLVSFYCTLRLLFITMALSTCLSHPRVFVKADQGILILRPRHKLNMEKRLTVSLDSSSRLFCQNNMGVGTNLGLGWSIVGGCKFAGRLNTDSLSLQKKRSGICSCLGTQFASCAFTLGTVAVLPFYTLMLFAPTSEILPGIAKMFSNEMTLASAWIHLLVVDLFAARHVYQDGLKNDVETRHSVSLCLLTCPVGILSHTITKALINQKRNRD